MAVGERVLRAGPVTVALVLQRPIRAIAYGFLIWWIWFGFVGIARFLPDSVTSAPSFATVRLLVLVVLVVFFAADYLHRIGRGSIPGDPTNLRTYLTTFAPLYLWIPMATTILFWRLTARTERAT